MNDSTQETKVLMHYSFDGNPLVADSIAISNGDFTIKDDGKGGLHDNEGHLIATANYEAGSITVVDKDRYLKALGIPPNTACE